MVARPIARSVARPIAATIASCKQTCSRSRRSVSRPIAATIALCKHAITPLLPPLKRPCSTGTWTTRSSLSSLPPTVLEKKNLWGISGTGFLYKTDILPLTQPTVSKHWMKHQQWPSSQWPALILSSLTTRLLTEGTLLPLQWLSNVRTRFTCVS